MSYITQKAVETYYEALHFYSIREKDVKKIGKSGNVVMIETINKLFMRTIKR